MKKPVNPYKSLPTLKSINTTIAPRAVLLDGILSRKVDKLFFTNFKVINQSVLLFQQATMITFKIAESYNYPTKKL